MAKRLELLEQNFLNTIKQNNLIQKQDKIVIGVSGGPDSITLLTCLSKYKEKLGYEIVVAHINHLIRKDSTEDEEFVEKICQNLNIKCYIKKAEIIKMSKQSKMGTEEMGRKVRYEFFDEVAQKESANKIAIAHNMNDNAETVLLNLIRGCGLHGLEGIQPKEYNKYIRPLINCKREEIEDYCLKYNLNPRIDSTNKENIYKRNQIRNELIPYLKNLNPNIIQNLSRLSKIVKSENLYINSQVENIYNKISKKSLGKIELEIYEFQKLDNLIKQNLIIYTIEKLLGTARNVQKINIDDIIKMAENNIGNKYIIINKHLKVLIKNKKVIFVALGKLP